MPGVENRVALVTGASRGIGLATARLLLSRGAKVLAVSRSASELASTGLPHVVAADLSTVEGCRRAVRKTEEILGPMDILVCNHGVGSADERPLQEHGAYDDTDEREGQGATASAMSTWRRAMDVNLEGPYHLTRLVIGGMSDRGYGRCVYVSSTAAAEAEPSAPGYNVSKSGLLGLMRSACVDGGARGGVTANAVLPGWVRTEMAERSAETEAARRGVTKESIWEERAALYPPKRVVEPDEVAHAILWLASEESSGVSGEAIRVSLGCPW